MEKNPSAGFYSASRLSIDRPRIWVRVCEAAATRRLSENLVGTFARFGEFLLVTLLLYSALMLYRYADIVANLEPAWIPWPLFWAYFSGAAMLTAGISFILRVKTRLAAILLTILFVIYMVFVNGPHLVSGILNQPEDVGLLWASNGADGVNHALEDFALTLSAVFLAASHRGESRRLALYAKVAATFYGGVMIVLGVEHFILTDYTPGIPSASTVGFQIPWLPFWGCLTGGVMLLGGSLIIFGKRSVEAAFSVGLLIFISASLTYILRAQAHLGTIPEFINLLKDLGVAGGAMILAKVLQQLAADF